MRPLSGGDINAAYWVRTEQGEYFCKTNDDSDLAYAMFAAEARGLERLSEAMRCPRVIAVGQPPAPAFLLLEYIAPGQVPAARFAPMLGRALARLHQLTAPAYGLDHDNFIGRLPQSNHRHACWADFYREERLQPQLRAARDAGRLEAADIRRAEQLYARLPALYPTEAPALLHGDLWSGNYLIAADGEPVLIDPAVYYGHREMDLAMMQLFGGFPAAVFTAYHEAYPLAAGWRDRLPLGQLYYLLVHVNLFAGAYVESVRRTLRALV